MNSAEGRSFGVAGFREGPSDLSEVAPQTVHGQVAAAYDGEVSSTLIEPITSIWMLRAGGDHIERERGICMIGLFRTENHVLNERSEEDEVSGALHVYRVVARIVGG